MRGPLFLRFRLPLKYLEPQSKKKGGSHMTERERRRRARQRRASHHQRPYELIVKERQRRRAASLDQALGSRIDEWIALTGTLPPNGVAASAATAN